MSDMLLEPNSAYNFKIRTVTKVGGNVSEGEWSVGQFVYGGDVAPIEDILDTYHVNVRTGVLYINDAPIELVVGSRETFPDGSRAVEVNCSNLPVTYEPFAYQYMESDLEGEELTVDVMGVSCLVPFGTITSQGSQIPDMYAEGAFVSFIKNGQRVVHTRVRGQPHVRCGFTAVQDDVSIPFSGAIQPGQYLRLFLTGSQKYTINNGAATMRRKINEEPRQPYGGPWHPDWFIIEANRTDKIEIDFAWGEVGTQGFRMLVDDIQDPYIWSNGQNVVVVNIVNSVSAWNPPVTRTPI